MNENNIFDDVMDYIDDNILKSTAELKRGIYATSNYSDMDYNKFLSVLTNGETTIISYIKNRKLYFAAKELIDYSSKPIVEIALGYEYSEQSSFTRAMKNYCGHTPNEIRKNSIVLPDNKLHFADFYNNITDNRLNNVLNNFEECGILCGLNSLYFEDFITATDEYGFDTSTCCAISEIAERLEIPFGVLLNNCFELMIDVKSDPGYINPKVEAAMLCDITSDQELEDICNYYNCKYYELNSFMVDNYRENIKTTVK